ncbi:DUF402 domain-containing protein [Paenibacillus doosanensis]|uniref:DUF402 domain-containing protein n=1 Tax=Paenibacillus konkukensis TaxID=2020716 RepID=A0ABY4RVY8_9BACL|nr:MULTISPECIES: DUF402 domain-containing protein [Paenibacillus]MCS7460759.1 DUF402 domain-containing protein [Paenibacillus doosanensis]UQZ85940.1 hypothetical protein SK3146_05230 [Paenibacillus konkukensis]
MESSGNLTIQSLKYGNHLHYEWNTKLLEQTGEYVFVLGEKGRKLHHYTKGKIFTMDHWTIEFFSFTSWFTVSADIAEGTIRQFYCNINQPARIQGNHVSFVDLDLDLICRGGEWKVVDEDEFATNAVRYGYPDELIARARQELELLQKRVAERKFPFDGTIDRWVERVSRNCS